MRQGTSGTANISQPPADLGEAVTQFELASRIDPLSPIISHVFAYTLANLGRYEEAEARFRKAVEIDPGFARAYQRPRVALLHPDGEAR